ncbi:MAG: hypothetical protein QW112_03655, partial [Candidatus Micrarchaeia archaeon]
MDTLMDDALMAKECRTTFPFVLCVLALLILLPMCSSADIICKTCDIAIIDLDYIYDPNISFDSVNVTARLYYVSIPEGRSAEEIIANIRSGWIDITKSKDIPTGTIPDENVSIFFRQLVGGQVYETVPCIKKTNASGMVNCIVQAGQGCGHIIAYYNGSDKYSNYTAMKIYCMRGAVPFGTVVGPECLVIFIFIGLLAAGMYVAGRDP